MLFSDFFLSCWWPIIQYMQKGTRAVPDKTASFFKYMEFVLTRNNVCKGNIEGRERGCRENLYWSTKNFWQSRWKTYTRFLTSTKNNILALWTTPKTLEPQWKNRLKELGNRSGLHSQRVELSRVKYFHAFVSSLNCLSHRCKQWQEKVRDSIENFFYLFDTEL